MKHICAEVGVAHKMIVKMEEYGICSVDDLMKINDRIKRKELSGIYILVLEALQLVVKWRESNEHADFLRDFNGEVLNKVKIEDQHAATIDKYIKFALGRPHDEEIGRYYEDIEGDNDLRKALLNKCKDEIMVPELRTVCGNFDYDSFIEKAICHFHALVKEPGANALLMEMLFVVAGRTQSGKASVKGVVQSLSGLLQIPLIILTKGVVESTDLHAKLVALAAGTSVKEKHIVVGTSCRIKICLNCLHPFMTNDKCSFSASSKNDGAGYKLKDERISEAMEGGHGGTLVIADTAQQILKKACPGKNFTVATNFHFPMGKTNAVNLMIISNREIQSQLSRWKVHPYC